jgi:hypothetical protein
LSIASLVLGILWILGVGSILALIFGYIGLRQIRRRGENGRGMAIAGIVLGWVGVGLILIFITLAIIGANTSSNNDSAPPPPVTAPAATAPANTDYAIQFANIIQPLNNESDPQNAGNVSQSQLTSTLQTMIVQLEDVQWPTNAQSDVNQLVANLQNVLAGNLNSTAGTTTAADEQKVANDLNP